MDGVVWPSVTEINYSPCPAIGRNSYHQITLLYLEIEAWGVESPTWSGLLGAVPSCHFTTYGKALPAACFENLHRNQYYVFILKSYVTGDAYFTHLKTSECLDLTVHTYNPPAATYLYWSHLAHGSSVHSQRDRRSRLESTFLCNTHCPERYLQECEHLGHNNLISFIPV